MPLKVKELKDDSVIEVKVNKTYYLMLKTILLNLVNNLTVEDKNAYMNEAITKEYKDLDDTQRTFYTITLLIAEIEKVALANDLFIEKEILEPGDEGYVAPKLG
jgi:hypothetical protein